MVCGLYSVCLCAIDHAHHPVINADFDTGWNGKSENNGVCVFFSSTGLVKTEILNWAACTHFSICTLFLLLSVSLPPPSFFPPYASLSLPACSCIAINSQATVPYFWVERDRGRTGERGMQGMKTNEGKRREWVQIEMVKLRQRRGEGGGQKAWGVCVGQMLPLWCGDGHPREHSKTRVCLCLCVCVHACMYVCLCVCVTIQPWPMWQGVTQWCLQSLRVNKIPIHTQSLTTKSSIGTQTPQNNIIFMKCI